MLSGRVCLCVSVWSLAASAEAPAGWIENVKQGQALQSQGRFVEAENRFAAAVREAERLPGRTDMQAAALSNLASVEIDLARMEEAAQLCRRAISLLLKSAGEGDAKVQTLRIELAGLYLESGQLGTAEKLLHRVIAVQAGQSKTASPEAVFALDMLACLYAHQRKFVKAVAAEQQALAVVEAAPPTDLTLVAGVNLHLSIFLNSHKRASEALPYAERAMATLQALPRRETVMEASAAMSLASIHVSLGRSSEALVESEQAMTAIEGFYGSSHPQTAWMLLGRAAILRRLEGKDEARPIQKRGESMLKASGKSGLGETVPVEALLPR